MVLADPPVYLVLHRWNDAAGTHVARTVQRVLVKFDDRQPQTVGDDTGAALVVGGVFEAVPPFDVRVGDRFTVDGQRGHITIVRPVTNGTKIAEFRLDGGVA